MSKSRRKKMYDSHGLTEHKKIIKKKSKKKSKK